MKELLKTDLRRMLKDKLFLVAIFIGLGLALFTPLIYKVLVLVLEEAAEMEDIFGMLFTAKGILGTSFAPLNNFGLILPVFLAIIIYKDFSYGTIRNKIISGKSRVSIYLSLLISSSIIMLICILGYTLIQFGFASLLFDYSMDLKFIEDLPYFTLTLLFGSLSYLFITFVIVFLCANMKNMGLAIVLYFGGCFLLTIIATITSTAHDALEVMGNQEVWTNIFGFLSNINLFYHLNFIIGLVEKYYISDLIYIVSSTVIFGGLFVLFGILLFRKKDLK